MKINYIQRKQIDYNLVQKYLTLSYMNNQFTNNGPVKALLEKKIETLINCPKNKRVLCVSNGTNALHALMFYYDSLHKRQLKWISPSFTFPSCVVNRSNTTLCDINPITYTLDPQDVKDADGIIITNLFGSVVNFDEDLFKDKVIIYDNASSFLSTDNGVNICLKGNASFASLHHTKTLGFGEGGFIVIDSDKYLQLQRICGFGFDIDRIHDANSSNFKLSESCSAMILQHIDNYDIQKHLKIQNEFKNLLEDIQTVELFNYSSGVFYGNLPILFTESISTNVFRDIGIEANKYYKPIENHINSYDLYSRIINFPLHMDLSEYDIQHIMLAISSYA